MDILSFALLAIWSRAIMYLLEICLLLVLVHGGGCNSFYLRAPQDTLAVVGDNVTLSCTLNVTACDPLRSDGYNDIILYWERKPSHGNQTTLSVCLYTYSNVNERYTISSQDLEWNLRIQNVQVSDARRYRCRVYSYRDMRHDLSSLAALTVVDPINTAVIPTRLTKRGGDRASFLCEANLQADDSYTWFVSTGGLRERIQTSDNFRLTGNGMILIISPFSMKHNSIRVACEVFRGNTSLTRQRQTVLLTLYPTETTTGAPPSVPRVEDMEPGTSPPVAPGGGYYCGTVTVQSPTTSPPPLTVCILGWVFSAILLVILALLVCYIVVEHRRKGVRPVEVPSSRGPNNQPVGADDTMKAYYSIHPEQGARRELTEEGYEQPRLTRKEGDEVTQQREASGRDDTQTTYLNTGFEKSTVVKGKSGPHRVIYEVYDISKVYDVVA